MNIDVKIVIIMFFMISIILYLIYKLNTKNKKNDELKKFLFNNLNSTDIEIGTLDDYYKNKYINLPIELIKDNSIISENLECIKKDTDWLLRTINKKGIQNISDVKYAILDTSGILQVIKYNEDKL